MNDMNITVSEDTYGTVTFENDRNIVTVNVQNKDTTTTSNLDNSNSGIESKQILNHSGLSEVGDDKSCVTRVSTKPVGRNSLGEEAYGGIIIGSLIRSEKTYLLIASKYNEGDSGGGVGSSPMLKHIVWCINRVGDGSLANSRTNGLYNTHQVLKNGRYSITESIFEWLDRYVQGTQGHYDWYIPSRDELDVLYQNCNRLDNYIPYYYWSSTESSSTGAHNQTFNSGYQGTCSKSDHALRVRAVRRQLI